MGSACAPSKNNLSILSRGRGHLEARAPKKKKMMDKKTRKAIFDDIGKSTIPEEMKVMYMMADATQTMVEHVYSRVQYVFKRHGYNTGDNELLTGLTDFCKAVKMADFHFYTLMWT